MPIIAVEPDSSDVAEEDLRRLAALSEAGLVDDLSGDDGLIYPLPEDASIASIVSCYDTRSTTNSKVRCSACKQHQWHFRGFRVVLSSGHHARLGVDCGERQFGAGAWQVALNDYERRAEHAYRLSRVEPTLKAISKIAPILDEWHSSTKKIAKWNSRFRTEMPQLADALANVARLSDGRFERQRKHKQQFVDRHGRNQTRTNYEVVTVGRIPFPGMFLGETPNGHLTSAKGCLGVAAELMATKSDPLSLAKAFANLKKSRQCLIDAANAHQEVLRNFGTDWLDGLCEWANRHEDLVATYTHEAGAIWSDEHGDDTMFVFLDSSEVGLPKHAEIMKLWPT